MVDVETRLSAQTTPYVIRILPYFMHDVKRKGQEFKKTAYDSSALQRYGFAAPLKAARQTAGTRGALPLGCRP